MAKSLFGGSAALTGALLLGSFIFYAHPSIAEDLGQTRQETQTQTKTEAAGASLSAEGTPLSAAAADAKLPAAPLLTDLEEGPPPPESKRANPAATINPAALAFTATAYSLRGRTASGLAVTRGLIAADRRVLPLGTRVRLEAGAYSGEYLVADLGGAVRGHKIDIWVPTTREAMRFGRRAIKLTILSHGAARRAGH